MGFFIRLRKSTKGIFIISKYSLDQGTATYTLVAGQTQTLQGMAGRTNFSPAIPFP